MRRNLLTVLNYFGYFLYAPSFEEIHTFFPKKMTKRNLKMFLDSEVKSKKILRLPNDSVIRAFQSSFYNYLPLINHPRYTLPQYSITRQHNNISRIPGTIQTYVFLLKLCPLVRFVGITGKSAMMGIRNDDDIDLCVVSKQGLLWTTRFFVVVLAKLLGIHSKTGVCLNLFFDENGLLVPDKKKNIYIAHELLQMKSIIDKNNIYCQFLIENRWLYRYFPNVKHIFKSKEYKTQDRNYTSKKAVDEFFKSIQLPIILRNRTAFFITSSQLWLFKSDFEKKLKRAGLVI